MRRHLFLALLLAGAAALIAGFAQLFRLRFEAGDVYPAYSSLRSDPLGTMALYESLGQMPGVSVRRDFSRSNRLPGEPNAVYLHLAARTYDLQELPADAGPEIESFTRRGGRLVITYFPYASAPFNFLPPDEGKTNSTGAPPSPAKKAQRQKEERPRAAGDRKKRNEAKRGEAGQEVSLEKRWGFHTAFQALSPEGDAYEPVRVSRQADLPLPRALSWHSGLILTNLDPSWRTVYARGSNAVVVERRFGRGTVVLATDSYYLSNEALLKDRQPEFLAWLAGSSRVVVFDEAHLGVSESPGVAALVRAYHLHGVVAGLVLLAALFIWKNSSSLVPVPPEERRSDIVPGRDAAAGFVNLLRRNIAPRDVLRVCCQEWSRTAGATGKPGRARLEQAAAVFLAGNTAAPKARDPVEIYRAICGILSRSEGPVCGSRTEPVPGTGVGSAAAPAPGKPPLGPAAGI